MCSRLTRLTDLFIKTVVESKRFDRNLRNVKLVSCSEGVVLAELEVGPEHMNESGSLHGGFISHLVDTLSTFALLAHGEEIPYGLSVDLSVSYVCSVEEGDHLEYESVVKRVDNKVKCLEVEIRNKDTDELVATGITSIEENPEAGLTDEDRARMAQEAAAAMAVSGALAERVAQANVLITQAVVPIRPFSFAEGPQGPQEPQEPSAPPEPLESEEPLKSEEPLQSGEPLQSEEPLESEGPQASASEKKASEDE